MTTSAEIFALRKQGRSKDALELARTAYPQNAADIWMARAYAWALYDQIKTIVESFEQKQLSPHDLGEQLTPYMREFTKFGDPLRKDSCFSQMIRLAGKASKGWQDFLGFARWAGVEDFAEEDKAPFVNDQGKTVDSLQKRFTRAICRETAAKAAGPHAAPDLVTWGRDILDQALQTDPHDQWLNYYQSKLHLAQGEADLATRRLAPVLRRQKGTAWPWALLGEILEAAQPDDALTCYAHAAQLAREEQEVAKTRIHLAQRLSLAGRFEEAACQASLALRYREQHGYKVPQPLAQLIASDWYRQAVESNSLKQIPSASAAAQALLQKLDRQNLTYTPGVIDHINADKALSYVATGATTGFGLSHRKFPDLAALAPGTLVDIGHALDDMFPLDWRLSQATALPGLCGTFSGSLERADGKDFAFIRTPGADIFVPPDQARIFQPGVVYDVSCLAIRRTNKHGKTSWRVVRFG